MSGTPPTPQARGRTGVRQRARELLATLARENASPARLAAACLVGGIVGATPFFGLHFFLCMGLAVLLRLNKVVLYAAANISIPPLAPFLATACVAVGAFILTGHAAQVDVETLRDASPWKLGGAIFAAWLAGAPVVGGAIGALLGAAVYAAARARARTRDEGALGDAFARAEEAVAERFASAPPSTRHYVIWKMRLDPAYRIVADGLPAGGHVVELGAGLGILPMLLTLVDPSRRITAIDWDAAKVARGRAAAAGLPVALDVADMRTFEVPPCDAVVLLDVLHYFDEDTQRAILRGAIAPLRAGGWVFVREADRARGAGRWTRTLERIAIRLGWNRGARAPTFRPIADICADLDQLGVDTTAASASASLYPGNAMIRGTKRV